MPEEILVPVGRALRGAHRPGLDGPPPEEYPYGQYALQADYAGREDGDFPDEAATEDRTARETPNRTPTAAKLGAMLLVWAIVQAMPLLTDATGARPLRRLLSLRVMLRCIGGQ